MKTLLLLFPLLAFGQTRIKLDQTTWTSTIEVVERQKCSGSDRLRFRLSDGKVIGPYLALTATTFLADPTKWAPVPLAPTLTQLSPAQTGWVSAIVVVEWQKCNFTSPDGKVSCVGLELFRFRQADGTLLGPYLAIPPPTYAAPVIGWNPDATCVPFPLPVAVLP
jgi:hypothetical protein